MRRARIIIGGFLFLIGAVMSAVLAQTTSLHAVGTPTITGISPASGLVAGGDSITITGTNFDNTATVRFGSNLAATSNWIDASTIVATTPAGYQGVADVSVTNQDGQTATLVNGFTYTEGAPTISGVTPSIGPTSGGQTVTVNGSNFTNGLKSVTYTSPDTIASGGGSTCNIYNGNKVYCWGYNGFGQLGNNSKLSSTPPVTPTDTGVLAGKTIKTIASGTGHRCVIASDGQVYCWGRNTWGQLGDGSTNQSSVAVAVDTSGVLSGKTIVQVGAGDQFSCALSSDGQVYCWGLGTNGQLGNSATVSSSVPVAVTMNGALAGKTVRQLSVGNAHSCVITNDNLGYCWGLNTDGRVGNNASASAVSSPTAVFTSGVLSGLTLTSISAGGSHTCAVASDNQAYCWGTGSSGQLGNSSTASFKQPVAVTTTGALSGKTILSVSSGTDHSCALASDSQAYCWGSNSQGQIGDNGPITVHSSPTAVDTSGVLAGKTLRTIVAAFQKTCTIASDAQAYCWGNNGAGALGDGTASNRKYPVAVTPIKGGDPTVTFGGTAASGVSLLSSSQLQVKSPAHSLGTVDVAVQNYDAQSATAPSAYQYVAGPTTSSITPSSGPIAGGTTVTIKGSNFYDGMSATLGGAALSNITVVDGQTITATTPSSSTPGAKDVVVSDPYGQTSTLTGAFTYRLPNPTITSVTPNQGSYAGGYSVTIKGSNFVDKGAGQTWYRVLFGTTNAASVTYVDGSTLTATVPGHGLGKVNVTIQSDYSNDAVLTNGFTYLAANYKFSNTPLNVAATQPGKLTIQSVNTTNNPVASSSDTVIDLTSDSQTGSFATDLNEDESTRWTHTSVVLPAGSTSVDVWYKDDTSGTPTITGTVGGAASFQQQETITSKYRFVVSGVSDPVSSGVPSSVTVRVVDYDGNPQGDYTGSFNFSSTDGAAQLPSSYTMAASDHGIKTFTNGVIMKTPGEFCVSATDISDSSITGSQCNISVRTANSGTIDHLSFITQSQSLPVNTTSAPITVQTQDAANNPVPVSVDTPLYVYSSSATASFSTDGSTWSSSPFQATLPAGSTAVNLFVKDSAAKTSTISVRDLATDTSDSGSGDSGWKNASQQFISGVSAADHIVLSGPDSLLVNEKGSYAITLKDSTGNTVTALQDNQFTLSSSTASALFYVDGDTVGAAGPVTLSIPIGASSVSFELSDSTASVGSTMTHMTLADTRQSGDASYLAGVEDDVQILSAAAGSVTLTPTLTTIEAGTSTSATVQLLDTNGDPTYASAPTTINLASSSTSGQFSLTGSPFTPITSISLQRGEGSKQVYYRDTLAGTSRIQATSSSLSSSSQTITVTSSDTYRYGVTPASSSSPLGAASSAITVTTYDVYGNVVLQPSDLTTYVYSSDPAITFASGSSGPWNVTSMTIPAGQSSAQVFAKSDSFIDQPATLTISDATPLDTSDTGIVNATSQLSISSQPVSTLDFSTSAQSIIAGEVSGAITVQLKQSDGSAAVQDGTTTLHVSVPEGKIVLSADASASGVTTVPIAKGSSSVTFYYTAQASGEYALRVQMGQVNQTQTQTVTSAAPSHLQFISSQQTLTANQISSQINVAVLDQYNNGSSFGADKTVSLASDCAGGSFSETSSPFSSTSSVNLVAGASSLSFYYKGTSVGTCHLTAALPGITSDSQTITILPSGPAKLSLHGPTSLEKGETGTYSVDATDAAGNITPVDIATDVSLTTTSSSGHFAPLTLHFAAGDTTQTFTYSDSSAGAPTLTASDTSSTLTESSLALDIADGSANKLHIEPSSSTLAAGDSKQLVISLLNQYDQPVTSASDVVVDLSSSQASGTFYDSQSLTQPITTATIHSGQQSVSLYYRQLKSVQTTLSAATLGLTQAQATMTVIPSSVAAITFITAPHIGAAALEVGETATYQVGLIDRYGNATTAPSPITLYASSTDGTLANGGQFTIPANTSSGTFSYTQTHTGSYTLTVSDTKTGANANLGPITQAGEVVAGTPDGISFTQSSLTLERGAVSGKLSVQLRNSYGYPVTAPSGGQVVNISMAMGTGEFSNSVNGSFSSSLQITIPEGETEAGIYYRNDTGQIEDRSCVIASDGSRTCTTTHTYQHTISAQTSLNSSPKAASLPVTMQYGAPTQLVITSPPRTQQTDRPTSLITIERQNQYGKPVPLHEDSTVNVSTSAQQTGTFGSSKIQWNVQSLKILDSNASTSFYYKDSQAGTPTLTVSSVGAPLVGDSQLVTITQGSGPPPPAASLIVTNISDPQAQGTPSSVIVIAVDADGFIVDSYAGSIHFTSDDPSAVLPADYTFNPSTDKGSKTFTNQVAFRSSGEKTVGATDTQGLTGSQTDITVLGANTNPIKSVAFVSPPSPLKLDRSEVSPLITIQLKDAAGNPTVAPQGGMPIRLMSEQSSGLFSDASQSAWALPYTVTIPEGLTYATFYYKDAMDGDYDYTLTASDWLNNFDQPAIANGLLNVMIGQPNTSEPAQPGVPSAGSGGNSGAGAQANAQGGGAQMPPTTEPQTSTDQPATGSQQTGDQQAPTGSNAASSSKKVSSPLITGSLGIFVVILLGEALRHVIAVHRFKKIISAHHIPSSLIHSLTLLKEATKSAFTSVFFWVPIAGSVVASIFVGMYSNGALPGLTVPQFIGSILLAGGLLVTLITVHSRYLSREQRQLNEFFTTRR